MARTNLLLIKRLLSATLAAATLSTGGALAQATGGSGADGAPADYASELRTLRPLAERGHAIAQFNLGVMHDFGQGIAKDPVQAVKWYRLAAAQGHGAAQFNLGGLYFEGLGVPRDLVRATMWFTLSAAAGIPGAAKNRSDVSAMLTPTELTLAQTLARNCRQREFKSCD